MYYHTAAISNATINDTAYNLRLLDILNKQITMEAFAGGDVSKLLTESFPLVVNDTKDYIVNFLNSFKASEPGLALNFNENKFIKEINKHAYLDYSPLSAYVPEGLNVKYLDYAVSLEKAATHVSIIMNGTLNKYSMFLSHLINNNDIQLSTSSFNHEFKQLEEIREKLILELGNCFKSGSTVTETTIGNVISRNADWDKVFISANTISKLINSVNRNDLNKKIKECTEYLDIIINKTKRNELNKLTPEGISNLSAGAYSMAKELEFFSIIYYKSLAYVNMLNKTAEHFNKIFKD